jgi:acyl-CoA synthetase (AMP-forming)/AMP-acid ligase II
VDAEALLSYVDTRLAHYKTPDSVEFVDALPRIGTGKVQKFALRDRAWTGHTRR